MTDDLEAKTNAWLIKAHKRAEWKKAHPSKKRVGWITSKPGYVPLCGGNSGQDWLFVTLLYTLLYCCIAGIFAALLALNSATNAPDDHALLWILFVLAWLGFFSVGYFVRMGNSVRMAEYQAKKASAADVGAMA